MRLAKFLLLVASVTFSLPGFSADFQKGKDAYNRGDYQAALREWRLLAEQGDAQAQQNLGHMYFAGKGVAQNSTKAAKWYRKSAEQGDAWAQFHLGTMYLEGHGVAQSGTEAAKWLRKSAEQGNPYAQVNLGSIYRRGLGVAQSDTEAVKWYRKSAEQGDEFAQSILGTMYLEGRGVAQSDTEAVRWFRKAAEHGYADAQKQLNRMGIDWTKPHSTTQEDQIAKNGEKLRSKWADLVRSRFSHLKLDSPLLKGLIYLETTALSSPDVRLTISESADFVIGGIENIRKKTLDGVTSQLAVLDEREITEFVAFSVFSGLITAHACGTPCLYISNEYRGMHFPLLESMPDDSVVANMYSIVVEPNLLLALEITRTNQAKFKKGFDIEAYMFGFGLGVPRNLKKAFELNEKSQRYGNYYAANSNTLICQSLLNDIGLNVAVDGYYGTATELQFSALMKQFPQLRRPDTYRDDFWDVCQSTDLAILLENLDKKNTSLTQKKEKGSEEDFSKVLETAIADLKRREKELAKINETALADLRKKGFLPGKVRDRSALAEPPVDTDPASLPNSEKQSRIRELEIELLALKADGEAEARSINQDSLRPTLQIIGKYSEDATGFIEGRVTDNVEVVELLVNDQPIALGTDGRFTHQEYLPTGGKEFTIVAVDRAGLKTTETVRLNREAPKQIARVSFDSLDPTTRRVKSNGNAIALIIGVAEYEKTAGAEYADRDAQVFYDYAHLKLGIPKERIQTLINDKADEVGLLSGINRWLKRSVKQGESDVYIFFAGHGLASDDGDTAYLIPYDGAPDFLERTAISRDEIFREVSSVNPRSVTVFLDTCYSGDTRGETRLIAGRPLNIKLQEQSLPKGFTVLTAAGGDQIAKPLKEAQHGLFSYFLMKGMEGGADSNSDNQITARELHTYVRENVVQQSGGSQVPELQGNGEKVLVRFR